MRASPGDRPAAGGRGLCAALGLLFLLGWVATWPWDVPMSRRLPDAREQATTAVRLSMERGTEDQEALRIAGELRARVGISPLDSRTRSVYSAVLLALSRTLEQTQAAAFHARLAAELAPVTTSVVRRSIRVLLGTGDFESARVWNRRLFEFDPAQAADMLIVLSPGLTEDEIEEFLPETPEAWLAWSRELRENSRDLEADRWAYRSFDRWPESPTALRAASGQALRDRDWERLGRIFSRAPEPTDDVRSSILLVYRAHLRLHQGELTEAETDLERALRLGPEIDTVWLHAGDFYSRTERIDAARSAWTRALHLTGPQPSPRRANLLARLARLEQSHGQASRAAKHWKEVLKIRPDDSEARRSLKTMGSDR